MTDARRPLHLAVLVGVSTGAYAVALAAVTTLQSGTDAAISADRAPYDLAADRMAAGHDQVEAALEVAARAYDRLAADYDGLTPRLTEMETSLRDLGDRTARLSESVSALPSKVSIPRMPTVRSAPAPVKASKPATHGTTGASG
jgi:pimeloyl-ACP methyl ester carboxylesterase